MIVAAALLPDGIRRAGAAKGRRQSLRGGHQELLHGRQAGRRPRPRECVKSHFGELSPPCQDIVLKVATVGKACKADFKQFCADVKPGGGRIEACMKTHVLEISDPCKDALSQAAGKS
jgi:hypothetical protein